MPIERTEQQKEDRELLARLDERVSNLTTALGELKSIVQNQTSELKSELRNLRSSVEEMVDRVNADIDGIRPTVAQIPDMKVRLEKLENRTSSLENWRWWMIGLAAGASAVVALIFKAVGKG